MTLCYGFQSVTSNIKCFKSDKTRSIKYEISILYKGIFYFQTGVGIDTGYGFHVVSHQVHGSFLRCIGSLIIYTITNLQFQVISH